MMRRVMLICSWLHQNRLQAPQPIVGQVPAAPPTIDRVVAAEILLVPENFSAEIGDRQRASLECLKARIGDFPLDRAQFFVEADDGGPWTKRQPFEQVTDFPIAEDTSLTEATV